MKSILKKELCHREILTKTQIYIKFYLILQKRQLLSMNMDHSQELQSEQEQISSNRNNYHIRALLIQSKLKENKDDNIHKSEALKR